MKKLSFIKAKKFRCKTRKFQKEIKRIKKEYHKKIRNEAKVKIYDYIYKNNDDILFIEHKKSGAYDVI